MNLLPYPYSLNMAPCSLCGKVMIHEPAGGWFSGDTTNTYVVRVEGNLMYVFCECCWVEKREDIVKHVLKCDYPPIEDRIRFKMGERFWEFVK